MITIVTTTTTIIVIIIYIYKSVVGSKEIRGVTQIDMCI
jgi:hypothetical protein